MKKLLTIITVTAFTVGLSAGAMAAKPAAESNPEATKKPDAAPAAEKVAGEGKAIPMYSRADVIDVAGKSFTTKKKDGAMVKHVITDTTEIKNGDAPAKLEDIKVGDYISGSRKKVSDTEYTVVKITKFGPKEAKQEGDAKPAADKAAPKAK